MMDPIVVISGLVTTVIGLSVFIRWVVKVLIGLVEKNTKAMTENTASNFQLSKSIDQLIDKVEMIKTK